jgi:hypothetical protein
LDLERHGIEPDTKSYRAVLSRHRAAEKRSKELLNAAINNALPLCDIAFEIIDTSKADWSSVKMVPLTETTTQPPHILYERAIPCTPRDHSCTVFLELHSDHSFRPIYREIPHIPKRKGGVTAYSVWVLPVSQQRPAFLSLPPDVLPRIAHFACHSGQTTSQGWLMSWALVCKAWLPVLDAFFECIHTQTGPKPDTAVIARTLEGNTEKGKLVTSLNTRDFARNDWRRCGKFPMFAEAHLKILTLATRIKTLGIGAIQSNIFSSAIQSLLALREVETFIVSGDGDSHPNMPDSTPREWDYLNMVDIQNLVKSWPKLRSLNAMRWDNTRHSTEWVSYSIVRGDFIDRSMSGLKK